MANRPWCCAGKAGLKALIDFAFRNYRKTTIDISYFDNPYRVHRPHERKTDMKKTLTALTAISVLLAPAALAESKAFSAKPFSKIEVKGVMDVVYKDGAETKVTVETPSGDFSDALIMNEGDTLVVTRESLQKKRSFFSWGGSTDISHDGDTIKVNGKRVPRYTVYVTGPDLESVQVSQSSTFDGKAIDAGDLAVSASSSSKAKLAGTSGETHLSASSSGEVYAKELKAKVLDISASSSGEATGTVTGTGETMIDASSSGEATVYSTSAASFNVNASSGGSVELSGACSSIEVSASSGAEVDGDDLHCKSANASASSGAEVDLHATDYAKGHASSGGDVSFSGAAGEQKMSESSGGSVRFTN